MITLILTCAGVGARAGFSSNKLLQNLDGKTVVDKVFNTCLDSGLFDQIIMTANDSDYPVFLEKFGNKATIVKGGKTRFLSVKNALDFVKGDIVLVHDGARPFVTKKVMLDCIESVKNYRSGIAYSEQIDTIAKADGDEFIEAVYDKKYLRSIQTPQGFYTEDIKKAFSLANGDDYPDESSVYSQFIAKPKLFKGDKNNIKLTYAEDFVKPTFRTGVGYDCHRLIEGRKLILGGIEIPHDKGLLGHSDADVLTHAVMDAILSAVALKDIGYHFPDSDKRYKNADSMKLLKKVLGLIDEKGYKVSSISACIMAEKPKLLPHIPAITKSLANALKIKTSEVGIGATTLEGLGFVGREEGICVHATAVVISK